MDLTLHRRADRRARRFPSAGPLGVLLASSALSVAFLVAVSDLVERLG